MMFTLVMVAYTASSMALAIAAGQSVVSVATLLMTISFVFMMVSTDSSEELLPALLSLYLFHLLQIPALRTLCTRTLKLSESQMLK